eukprot:scaffold647996_cov28-Prasinocladus_malaysianus.AAC.1
MAEDVRQQTSDSVLPKVLTLIASIIESNADKDFLQVGQNRCHFNESINAAASAFRVIQRCLSRCLQVVVDEVALAEELVSSSLEHAASALLLAC